jgi:hypothetical protein
LATSNQQDRGFPEDEHLFSDVFLKSSRAIPALAATADDLARFDLTELAALCESTSHGRFSEAKAREVTSAAARSLGVSSLADAY